MSKQKLSDSAIKILDQGLISREKLFENIFKKTAKKEKLVEGEFSIRTQIFYKNKSIIKHTFDFDISTPAVIDHVVENVVDELKEGGDDAVSDESKNKKKRKSKEESDDENARKIAKVKRSEISIDSTEVKQSKKPRKIRDSAKEPLTKKLDVVDETIDF